MASGPDVVWRYLPRSHRRHALVPFDARPDGSPAVRITAASGLVALRGEWLGGTTRESGRVSGKLPCGACLAAITEEVSRG